MWRSALFKEPGHYTCCKDYHEEQKTWDRVLGYDDGTRHGRLALGCISELLRVCPASILYVKLNFDYSVAHQIDYDII